MNPFLGFALILAALGLLMGTLRLADRVEQALPARVRKVIKFNLNFIIMTLIVYTSFSTGRVLQSREHVQQQWELLVESQKGMIEVFGNLLVNNPVELPSDLNKAELNQLESQLKYQREIKCFNRVLVKEFYDNSFQIQNAYERIVKESKGDLKNIENMHQIFIIKTRDFNDKLMSYHLASGEYKDVLDSELLYLPSWLKMYIFKLPILNLSHD